MAAKEKVLVVNDEACIRGTCVLCPKLREASDNGNNIYIRYGVREGFLAPSPEQLCGIRLAASSRPLAAPAWLRLL